MPRQDHGSLTEGKQDQLRTQIPKFTVSKDSIEKKYLKTKFRGAGKIKEKKHCCSDM